MSLVSRDEKTGSIREARKKKDLESFIVPFVVTLLLAMIVMASSAPMLGAIAEDKMQRVYEMLLGKASPFELMMGKVIAAVGLSLTSSVFYILGGLAVLQSMAHDRPRAAQPAALVCHLPDCRRHDPQLLCRRPRRRLRQPS